MNMAKSDRLNLQVDADLLKRFREAANKKFSEAKGHTKGALKAAAEEAIEMWLAVETEGSWSTTTE